MHRTFRYISTYPDLGVLYVECDVEDWPEFLGFGKFDADHGNDPTWPGTDHTREHIPILVHGTGVSPGLFLGARESFADIGQTIANYFSLPAMDYGRSLLD